MVKKLYTSEQKGVIDPKKLRYVLYARKSSEDETSQEKSIPDQISYCKEMAGRLGIKISRIYQEARSARKSDNRPEFKNMLQEIRKGTYDAIIAYHPDRLARNSLDSGMIIDMLDNDIIKDLKFPTCQFENNSSGKLLLNILFAMSKEYSEHLSEVVNRGNNTNREQGKSNGKPVWGYNRSKLGHYEPDANFDIVRKGWEMRLNGKNQTEIAEFWKNNGVIRENKGSKTKNEITRLHSKQQASKLFRDPIYYGLLIEAGNEIDLREIPAAGFQPMITEEEYNKVQMMDNVKRLNLRSKKCRSFYPLRQFVKCSHCGKYMMVGPSKSRSGKKYLYFRCDTKECPMRGKSVRANVIFDAIFAELEKLKFNEKTYKSFADKASSITREKLDELKITRQSYLVTMRQITKKMEQASEDYAKLTDKGRQMTEDSYNRKLEEWENQKIDLQTLIDEIDEQIIDPDKMQMSLDEFLNLANSASDKMRAGTPVQKDDLCRIIFLNLTFDHQKGATFLWKEPFSMLVNNRSVNSGGRSVTLLEPIYIITNWFLNDNNQTSFKLPKITATERRQQILDMNYVF